MARHRGASGPGSGIPGHRTCIRSPHNHQNCSEHVQMRVRQPDGRMLLHRPTDLAPVHELCGISETRREITTGQPPPWTAGAHLGSNTRVLHQRVGDPPACGRRCRSATGNSPAKSLTLPVRDTVQERTERTGAHLQPERAEEESSCLREAFRCPGISPSVH